MLFNIQAHVYSIDILPQSFTGFTSPSNLQSLTFRQAVRSGLGTLGAVGEDGKDFDNILAKGSNSVQNNGLMVE